MRTLIIAEAGVNHNGDPAMARALINAAADAGADLVKFQTFRADRLVTASAPKAQYQLQTTPVEESQHAMIRQLELSEAMHEDLLARCHARGIGFFSTAFDLESLDYLMRLGMPRIKVPSGEITNLPYLRRVGSYGKPVLLSTGMSKLGEIEAAIDVLEGAGTARAAVTVLHCNTEYPVPMDEVNLRAMLAIRDAFGVAVGFSDHTEGCEAAIAAVAMGATVIEKHFTLDRTLPGPDHRASLAPDQLALLVRSIRNVEKALGDGIKRPGPSERRNLAVARKSLVAARAIARGEPFSEQNLAVKRPGTGISPMRIDELIGKPARRDYLPDELID
jgi:N,N'-diacetyllegionaminate synthase